MSCSHQTCVPHREGVASTPTAKTERAPCYRSWDYALTLWECDWLCVSTENVSEQIKIRLGITHPIVSPLLCALFTEIAHQVSDKERGGVKVLVFLLILPNTTCPENFMRARTPHVAESEKERVHVVWTIYLHRGNSGGHCIILLNPLWQMWTSVNELVTPPSTAQNRSWSGAGQASLGRPENRSKWPTRLESARVHYPWKSRGSESPPL